MNFDILFQLLAQEGGGGTDGQQGGGMGSMLIPMILIMVMFYFILIRPQRKQQKAQEEMRNSLGIGDKVVTAGGIHGIITGQTKTTVSVKVADGMSIKFDRASIGQVVSRKGEGTPVEELADDDPADENE
ncbi:MAG: preprotein translocase subunit YajC [Verrucomicrobiales bacterium]|nr:preprotein translocase subunit YajC [Verrucomicrobiales bacterium]